jgi:hypothetical protein
MGGAPIRVRFERFQRVAAIFPSRRSLPTGKPGRTRVDPPAIPPLPRHYNISIMFNMRRPEIKATVILKR